MSTLTGDNKSYQLLVMTLEEATNITPTELKKHNPSWATDDNYTVKQTSEGVFLTPTKNSTIHLKAGRVGFLWTRVTPVTN